MEKSCPDCEKFPRRKILATGYRPHEITVHFICDCASSWPEFGGSTDGHADEHSHRPASPPPLRCIGEADDIPRRLCTHPLESQTPTKHGWLITAPARRGACSAPVCGAPVASGVRIGGGAWQLPQCASTSGVRVPGGGGEWQHATATRKIPVRPREHSPSARWFDGSCVSSWTDSWQRGGGPSRPPGIRATCTK